MTLDKFIDEYRAENESKGLDHLTSLEDVANLYGFEFRWALPLQYLFACNIYPLGRAVLVVGEPHSGKSQFAIYIARLCADNGGLIHYTETEGKPSKDQIYGLFDGDMERVHKHMTWKFAKNIEIAQSTVMATSETYETKCMKYDYWPAYLNVIDSIAGITSQKAKDAIQATGTASQDTSGMHNAAAWKKYFQAFVPDHVAHLPFGLLIVNHEGEEINISPGGGAGFAPPKKTTGQGGKHKDFMSSFTISCGTSKSVKRLIGKDSPYGPHTRTKYYMTNMKNCFGVKGARIEYEVISYEDEAGNTILKYDWNTALIDMLTDEKGLNLPAGSVEEVLDLKGEGQRWSCPLVGVPHGKDSYVDKETMGQLLHENEETYRLIQKQLLHVKVKPVWGDPATTELAKREIEYRLKERATEGAKTKRQRRK